MTHKKHFKKILFLGLMLSVLLTIKLNAQSQNSTLNAKTRLKSSLNAYSFNEPLSNGSMDVFDLMAYCAAIGFDAVDITAYYFDGYPNVPPNDYLYKVKQQAFLLGLDISGTGVRTNFTSPNSEIRNKSIQLVKSWVDAAEKMGIPIIRIFAGEALPNGFTHDEVTSYMIDAIKACVAYGKQHGVIIGIQNHWDFIKTSDQVIDIIKRVDSEWFGLILDIGSFKSGNPYTHIEACIPYAVSWQIKEYVYVNGIETKTDLNKLMSIIKPSGYQGYIPIETLGSGDPKIKVKKLFKDVLSALN
ncbi:sugar phosphate isomerase/epimerase family protein [Confluentibacter citreus]|uniref:sugar phosphate isomerase/epimerase family protein n=1 Tax=Confluentibacter citreus TaxID=2007307 RepID=UPI000C29076C|nr:sugar phosphate isomerase/epimerase family protein [Confluentibacter citreus]